MFKKNDNGKSKIDFNKILAWTLIFSMFTSMFTSDKLNISKWLSSDTVIAFGVSDTDTDDADNTSNTDNISDSGDSNDSNDLSNSNDLSASSDSGNLGDLVTPNDLINMGLNQQGAYPQTQQGAYPQADGPWAAMSPNMDNIGLTGAGNSQDEMGPGLNPSLFTTPASKNRDEYGPGLTMGSSSDSASSAMSDANNNTSNFVSDHTSVPILNTAPNTSDASDVSDTPNASNTTPNLSMFAASNASNSSVYTIVPFADTSSEAVLVTSLDNLLENVPYYMSIFKEKDSSTHYITNQQDNSSSPKSIKKDIEFRKAAPYFFEKYDASLGKYHIYTYDANNNKKYLRFESKDGSNGHLLLGDTKGIFTITDYNAANGLYGISGAATDNPSRVFYINLHAENKFAGWKDPPTADKGSRVKIFSLPIDPLQIDGEEYIIVNADQWAVSAKPKRSNNGFDGLEAVEVVKIAGTEQYSLKNDNDTLPLWKFTAKEDGSYTVTTYVDGVTKYIGIEGKDANNAHVTLSETEQRLSLTVKNGKVQISNSYHTKCRLDRFSSQGNVFAAYAQDNPNNNEMFTLAKPEGNYIKYTYAKSNDDTCSSRDLAEKTIGKSWLNEHMIELPDVNSYTATEGGYDYIYSFQHWSGSDGEIYEPGDILTNTSDNVITLELTTVWNKEKTVTYKYNLHSEDTFPHNSLLTTKVSAVYPDGIPVAAPDYPSYQSFNDDYSKGYLYVFDHWLGSDGLEYSPGDNMPEYTDSFCFTAVWVRDGDMRDTFTINNRVSDGTAKVLEGADYIYEIEKNKIGIGGFAGAIAFDTGKEIVSKSVLGENDERFRIQISNVRSDCDIYPLYRQGTYNFYVIINDEFTKLKSSYQMEPFKTGNGSSDRQYYPNSYLHDIYGKFFNVNIQTPGADDYVFGHSDKTEKTYNRKSADGITTFFNVSNSGVHNVFYTPYIPVTASGDEINFSFTNNLKKESFYAVSLAEKLQSKYTAGELEAGPLRGTDITTPGNEFLLQSVTNDDFANTTAFSALNVIGHYGRSIKIELTVPDIIVANKANGSLITELYMKGMWDEGSEITGTYDPASRKYTFLIPSGETDSPVLNQPYEIRLRNDSLCGISVYDGNEGMVTITDAVYTDIPASGSESPSLSDNRVIATADKGIEIKFSYNALGMPQNPTGIVVCMRIDPDGKITRFDGMKECGPAAGGLYHFVIPGSDFDSDYIIIERNKAEELKCYRVRYDISPKNGSEDIDNSFPLPNLVIDGAEKTHYTEYVKAGGAEPDDYENYMLRKPMAGTTDASGKYFYKTANGKIYQFAGWRVMVNGVKNIVDSYSINNINLNDYVSGYSADILFEAEWAVTNRQVRYVLSLVNEGKVSGTKPSLNSSIRNNIIINSRNEFEHYTTADYTNINPGSYSIKVNYNDSSGTSHEETVNYEFIGWETERGEIIECAAGTPGEVINLDEEMNDGTGGKRYDADDDSVITLKTRWKPDRMIVVYNLNIANTGNIAGDVPTLYPETNTNEFIITGQEIGSYYVKNVNPVFYRTELSETSTKQTEYDIRDFMGWNTESGAKVLPEEYINLDTLNADMVNIYDTNKDGVISFTGKWGTAYENKNDVEYTDRRVNFYVLLKAANDDIFNFNPELSTDATLFSPSVHKTLMRPFETAPDVNGYDKGNGSKRFYLANYNPDEMSPPNDKNITFDNIAEVNTAIRCLGNGRGYFCDGKYYYTVDFPTDEQVFDSIKRGMMEKNVSDEYKYTDYANKEFNLNGVKVSRKADNLDKLNALTTENYTIDWYVCKLQNDGWHIDGKLMPKVSFVTVTKTFNGNKDAIDNIPEDFNITVDNVNNKNIRTELAQTLNTILHESSDPNIAGMNFSSADVKNEQLRNALLLQIMNIFGNNSEEYNDAKTAIDNCNANENQYRLVLTDRTDIESQSIYGFINGKPSNGEFGYTKRSGNKYTWIVPSSKNAKFDINENNYEIFYERETAAGMPAESVPYGIIAQYSITNTTNNEDTGLTQWFSQLTGTSATYPRDIINLSSTQATNLFNTYVTTDVFTIQVRDTQEKGESIDNPMPGVKLKLYEIDGGSRRPLKLEQKGNSSKGEYTVLLGNIGNGGSGTAVVNHAETPASGNITLNLPVRPNICVYEVVEEVPKGYKGYNGSGSGFSFKIEVGTDGSYTVQAPDGEAIERIIDKDKGEYDYNDSDGNCALNVLVIGTPGDTGGDLTMGAMVINKPETFTAIIKKQWGEGVQDDQANSVKVALKGYLEGSNSDYIIDEEKDLNTGNDWEYVWKNTAEKADELPLMIGNKRVIYEVEETKINEDMAGTSGFNTWEYTIGAKFWDNRAGSGAELSKDGNRVAANRALDVRKAEYTITNDLLTDAARVYIRKGDYNIWSGNDNIPALLNATQLGNTAFHIYKAADLNASGGFNKQYDNGSGTSTVFVLDKGIVTFPDGKNYIERRFEKGSVYYIEEISAPEGYQVYDGLLEVRVLDNKQLSFLPLKEEGMRKKHISVRTADGGITGYVTFYDVPDCVSITKVLTGSGSSNRDKFSITIENAALAHNTYAYSVGDSENMRIVKASGGILELEIQGESNEGLVTSIYGLPQGTYSVMENPKGYTLEEVEIDGIAQTNPNSRHSFYHTSSTETNIKLTNRQDGIDVRFMKTGNKLDNNGRLKPLGGAKFTLYETFNPDAADDGNMLVNPLSTEEDGKFNDIASSDGTGAFKDSEGNTIEEGVVLFEKVPVGIYYMKETGLVPEISKKYSLSRDMYVVLVGDQNLTVPNIRTGTVWADVLKNIGQEDIDRQTKDIGVNTGGSGNPDDERTVSYAIFKMKRVKDPEAEGAIKYYADPGTTSFDEDKGYAVVMNESRFKRKVIIRMVSDDDKYIPLNKNRTDTGMTFTIYRADGKTVMTDADGNSLNRLGIRDGGVIYVGKLPMGTYYIKQDNILGEGGYSRRIEVDTNARIFPIIIGKID